LKSVSELPAGSEECVTSIALVVENVVFPVSEAFTYGDGDAFVSTVQPGVAETEGPPAFTR
jgi:hypothetical protein